MAQSTGSLDVCFAIKLFAEYELNPSGAAHLLGALGRTTSLAAVRCIGHVGARIRQTVAQRPVALDGSIVKCLSGEFH